ncbi:MAG: hypothetical protein Q6373_002530 [Candidatus Sigynarchaeota archaeon]
MNTGTAEPAGLAETRDRGSNRDNLIVIAATVAMFIILDAFITSIVKFHLAVLGKEPDVVTGLYVLLVVGSISIAFSCILAYLLRRRAAKRSSSPP